MSSASSLPSSSESPSSSATRIAQTAADRQHITHSTCARTVVLVEALLVLAQAAHGVRMEALLVGRRGAELRGDLRDGLGEVVEERVERGRREDGRPLGEALGHARRGGDRGRAPGAGRRRARTRRRARIDRVGVRSGRLALVKVVRARCVRLELRRDDQRCTPGTVSDAPRIGRTSCPKPTAGWPRPDRAHTRPAAAHPRHPDRPR